LYQYFRHFLKSESVVAESPSVLNDQIVLVLVAIFAVAEESSFEESSSLAVLLVSLGVNLR